MNLDLRFPYGCSAYSAAVTKPNASNEHAWIIAVVLAVGCRGTHRGFAGPVVLADDLDRL